MTGVSELSNSLTQELVLDKSLIIEQPIISVKTTFLRKVI